MPVIPIAVAYNATPTPPGPNLSGIPPNLHDCYVEAYREEVKKRRRIGAWSGLAGCALLVMFLNSPAIVN